MLVASPGPCAWATGIRRVRVRRQLPMLLGVCVHSAWPQHTKLPGLRPMAAADVPQAYALYRTYMKRQVLHWGRFRDAQLVDPCWTPLPPPPSSHRRLVQISASPGVLGGGIRVLAASSPGRHQLLRSSGVPALCVPACGVCLPLGWDPILLLCVVLCSTAARVTLPAPSRTSLASTTCPPRSWGTLSTR